MSAAPAKILLIGYGNPGRLDDGLGPALADAVGRQDLPGVTVDANYQLTVEDAAAIAEHDVVVFADAHVSCDDPFRFQRVEPRPDMGFTTHSVAPEAVLGMARDLFGADTAGYALGIRGHEFDAFGERLSERARSNLVDAIAFLEPLLRERDTDRFADACNAHPAAGSPSLQR